MKIVKSNDQEIHGIFALICGSVGVGKTSLVKTLPHEETLILSAESGLLSIKDVEIDVINIEKFQDLLDAFTFINGETKYKNIYVDSLTEIGELLFNELKPNYTKSQTFALYSDYAERMTKMLKAFRDLSGYNVYFTALDKMTAKDFTEVVTIDLIQKSLSKKLPALLDLVFYYQKLKREDGTTVRALCTDSDDVDFTKDRSGKLDKYEKPDLSAIQEKVFN
jgi:phage nucleotide-binding protein